jgi:hypothetical protein
VSRGLGVVQRSLLFCLSSGRGGWTAVDLAATLFNSDPPSKSQIASVRRALASLAREGSASSSEAGQTVLWQATKQGEALLRRSRARARRRAQEQRAAKRDLFLNITEGLADALGDDRKLRQQLARALTKVASPIEAVALEAGRAAERIRQQLGQTWDQLLRVAPVRIPADK